MEYAEAAEDIGEENKRREAEMKRRMHRR